LKGFIKAFYENLKNHKLKKLFLKLQKALKFPSKVSLKIGSPPAAQHKK
jgi:hypothetical protein